MTIYLAGRYVVLPLAKKLVGQTAPPQQQQAEVAPPPAQEKEKEPASQPTKEKRQKDNANTISATFASPTRPRQQVSNSDRLFLDLLNVYAGNPPITEKAQEEGDSGEGSDEATSVSGDEEYLDLLQQYAQHYRHQDAMRQRKANQ
jgi:hypothetical protein